jgi:hypothetical protein
MSFKDNSQGEIFLLKFRIFKWQFDQMYEFVGLLERRLLQSRRLRWVQVLQRIALGKCRRQNEATYVPHGSLERPESPSSEVVTSQEISGEDGGGGSQYEGVEEHQQYEEGQQAPHQGQVDGVAGAGGRGRGNVTLSFVAPNPKGPITLLSAEIRKRLFYALRWL